MLNEHLFDYIVIGSGPSAAMAALTLVQSKKQVLMLDVGHKDEHYQQMVPAMNFETIRRTVQDQHRFFLGDKMESMPVDGVKVGAQLSPSRKAMIKDVEKLIPMLSDNFTPMESLGYGGLGAGWGLGSYVYSQGECEKVGLPYAAMQDSYQFVADHIGVSGGDDDVSPLILGSLKNIQAPLIPDNAAQKLFAKYQKNKAFFEKNKAYFGHPAMAILTADKGERKATSYFDTDFYADIHQSAYRPQFTIDALKNEPNFTYHGGQLVLSFTDKESAVEVNSLDLASNSKQVFKAKKLVIAAGALGTARLVMRSLPQISRLPLLCNPYAYVPGIQWSMLGKKLDSKKSSMAQAMMIYDADGKNDDLVSLAFYTYQSLMLFRLIKESPLNIADNRILFQYLQSAFVIAGVHHPDRASDLKYLTLDNRSDSLSSDILMASYQLTGDEKINIRDREKVIWKLLNKLGVMPIKKLDPGAGSSIHYGGTVPFSITDKLGTQSPDGRLYATKNVFIADSSGFNFLPAKGVTLSLMANANRVCKYLIAYD